jgi:hypothetical protein
LHKLGLPDEFRHELHIFILVESQTFKVFILS